MPAFIILVGFILGIYRDDIKGLESFSYKN